MFFSRKSGSFHCLLLYIQKEEPRPLLVVMPQEVAADVISTMRKFQKSVLNDARYIGGLGPFLIIHDIQGFEKIDIYEDGLPWAEPVLYTDYAKTIGERLQPLVEEEPGLEEELVYFVGEFTMMQDNGFSAPF